MTELRYTNHQPVTVNSGDTLTFGGFPLHTVTTPFTDTVTVTDGTGVYVPFGGYTYTTTTTLPTYQPKQEKQMFTVTTAKTRAGVVGQVLDQYQEIVWESKPFSKGKKIGENVVSPLGQAQLAAKNAIRNAGDNLFKEL